MTNRQATCLLAGILLGVLVIWLSGCGACVDDDQVRRAVQKQGYSEVKLGKKSIILMSWTGCGRSDAAAYEATALSTKGKRVDLIVCAGWPYKGVTVRTK
jgi:hypothetical protein